MQDALTTAREIARHWREANPDEASGGVIIVLGGMFVGHATILPPVEYWAPGCLAIDDDGRIHLLRQTDWRGGLEWADLGTPADADASGSPTDPPPSANLLS